MTDVQNVETTPSGQSNRRRGWVFKTIHYRRMVKSVCVVSGSGKQTKENKQSNIEKGKRIKLR